MRPSARAGATADPHPDRSPAWTGELVLRPCRELHTLKGLPFPASVKFRQIVVTGPPGAGKSYVIRRLGGWPEEGYIDLTLKHWWRARSLSLRPREINLGFPFEGHEAALSVFDEAFLRAPERLRIDTSRIRFPPERRHFWSPDWRARYAFFFLVPPPETILSARLARVSEGAHPVDESVTLGDVERQVGVYRAAAVLFHRAAMTTYVVDHFGAKPKRLEAAGDGGRAAADVSG